MKFQAKYSGNRSKRFWKVINSLPEKHRNELYSLGCALQDLEHRVLTTLHNAKELQK